jgi:HD superfamily phosphohydrolase
MDDLANLRAFLEKFEESAVNPDLHLEMVLKGQVDTYKKNRIRIRMDYIKAHIISKEFKLKDITDLMKIVSAFGEGEEAEMIMNNPAFKLLERS